MGSIKRLLKVSKNEKEDSEEKIIVTEKDTQKKDKKIGIKSAQKYKQALENGVTSFDFSNWSLDGDNIENINLENLGLNINLRKVFVPIGGVIFLSKIAHTKVRRKLGDDFLDLRNSNLKGNNIVGGLEDRIEENGRCSFLYNRDTFDEMYIRFHSKFFLDELAPQELKDKYYNPSMVEKETQFGIIKVMYRQKLTYDEYLKYYEFLHGKYLERFSIDKKDFLLIKLSEVLGLEKTKDVLSEFEILEIPIEEYFEIISGFNDEDIKKYFEYESDDKNAKKHSLKKIIPQSF